MHQTISLNSYMYKINTVANDSMILDGIQTEVQIQIEVLCQEKKNASRKYTFLLKFYKQIY